MTKACWLAVPFVVTEMLWNATFTTADQALNINKRPFSASMATDVVPKECHELKVFSKLEAYLTTRRCFKIRSTRTGILFWKKTRYYKVRSFCTRYEYRQAFDTKRVPICCDGYTEFEGNCKIEMTSPPNITCACLENEESIFNAENGTCSCIEKYRICTDEEVDKMAEVAANCSMGCIFQEDKSNCTARCNCTEEEEVLVTAGSQIRPEHEHTSPAGILVGTLILLVVAIVAIVAIVIIVKKRIIGIRSKRPTISNLSYGLIDVHDNVIPSSVHDADHYASTSLEASETGADGDAPTCLTHCKSLAVSKKQKENDYVLVGVENGKLVTCADKVKNETPCDKVKTESPYDYPKHKNDLSSPEAERNAVSYDFPKSNGQCITGATAGNVYDVVRFQKTEEVVEEKESSYDTPKSYENNQNAYSLVKTNRNQVIIAASDQPRDRAYITMSVSSKGKVDIQGNAESEDDLYVLPSETDGDKVGDENEGSENKLRHTYSNVSVGPYENV